MNTLPENIVSYRLGIVTKSEISHYACCTILTEDEEMFRYVELILSDGVRKYVYDNKEVEVQFEANFYKNRYTSFHEFFTTEELIEEVKPSGLKFKAYKRRADDSYIVFSTEEALNQLENMKADGKVKRLANRVTTYGKYSRTVDYGEEICEG